MGAPEPKIKTRSCESVELSGNILLESVHAAVLVLDLQTDTIVLSNTKANHLFLGVGCRESLAGHPIKPFLCIGNDGVDRALAKNHLHTPTHYSNVVLKNREGSFLFVDATCELLKDHPDSKHMVITLQDMEHTQFLLKNMQAKETEMETILSKLERQNGELKKIDEMRNHFISLVSHELRTPLSGLLGNAELLRNGLVESEQERHELLEVIHSEGRRLMDIVNDFLDMTRMMAGTFELHVSLGNVLDPLKKAIQGAAEHARKMDVRIVSSFSAEREFDAYFDADRLHQVFANILSNACKFTPRGKKVEISVEDYDAQGFVLVKFKDEGIGIKEEHFSKIFAEFQMVENIKEHQKGTGLGMPLSRKFMRAMRGELYFESQYGVGTTFFVKIPTSKLLDDSNYKRSFSDDPNIIF